MSSEEVKAGESTSFAEHLKPETENAPDAPAETPAVETVVDDKPAESAPEAPVETPAAPEAPKVDPAPQAPGLGFVPIAAVQAERAKRQELEARLREIESTSYVPESAPPAQTDVANLERNLRASLSEEILRSSHPDYDEKVNAFSHEVYDLATGQLKNQALYESVMSSPLPAKAAYQAGLQILEAKKLGGWDVVSDPVKYRQAIEKQIRGDLEKEIRQKLEVEIAGKAQAKSKTITDIGQARAASGAVESEFVTPSFAQHLAVSKRKR